MIIQKFFILCFLILVPAGITSLKIEEKNLSSESLFSLNIDSIISEIKFKGWGSSAVENYSFYLRNSELDFVNEKKRITDLPASIEKTYLYSVILKREHNFKDMFDSLISSILREPQFLEYYDELVFAANASGQLSIIENRRGKEKVSPLYHDYLSGLIHSKLGAHAEALNNFLKALESDSANYNILYQVSNTYKYLGDYEESINALNKAEAYSNSDERFLVKKNIAEGTLNFLSGNYKNAQQFYEDALSLARKLDDRQNEVTSLINLGIIFDLNSRIEAAREYFQMGLELSKKINDLEGEAFALSESGVSFTFTNNIIEAKENYLKSYEIYERINDQLRLSLLSENIGKIFVYLFDYETALKFYEKGIEYAGDNKRAQAVNLIGMADVYANLSNYSKALRLYNEAAEISSQIKELSLRSQINNGLGSLNFNLNRFDKALKYFNDIEKWSEASDDVYTLGDAYYKSGLTYLMIDSLEQAAKYLMQAISITSESGDYYTEALSYANMTSLEIKKENYTGASSYLDKARLIAQQNSLDYLSAECSLIEGGINRKQKNFNSAKIKFEDALRTGQKLNEFNIQIESYRQLAEMFSENNLNEGAESYYNSAINLVEDISRPLFEEEEVQISYFSGKSDIYNSLAEFYLKQERFEEAFEVIDKSRSRSTVQNLKNLKLKSIIKDDNLISKLYDYEWLIRSGIYSEAKTDSVKIQLSMLKKNIISKYPASETYLYNRQALTIKEISSALNDDENILSIYSNEEETHFFLINRNEFHHSEKNISKNSIRKYLAEISPYYSFENGLDKAYFNQDLFSFNAQSSNKFYNDLFKDAFNKIPDNSKIIIAPSVELITVPVELLVVNYMPDESPYNYSGSDFLINHYNISYAPSAAVFVHQKNSSVLNEDKIVVIGDPAINTSENNFSQRRGLLEERAGIPRNIALLPLKYSEEEINQVGDLINADKVFIDGRATETNFKLNAELSRIIHLSTHSFLYNKQPVIFFSNKYDAENDGFLETPEIVQLKLNSDLVVLSSCNSGLGTIDNAEGILGMTKAFFEAGTKSVIVSLWEVNDKFTSKFMALFYKKLQEGNDKSEALRLAKLEFIKKYSPNPYYWGAFILSGDISKIQIRNSNSALPYVAGIILFICFSLAAIFIYNKRNKHSA